MRKYLTPLVVVAALSVPSISVADTTELKTTLQSSLQRSIERLTIEGGFQRINLETGETEVFYPVDTHPMILRLGSTFVMCSDLKRPDGSSVQVDYYLTKKGRGFALVQTEIDNRAPLRALIKAGKAKQLK